MQYEGGSAFICTGTLISGNSIATAAHCVSDGYGTKGPARVRAYFTDSLDPDLIRFDSANDFNAVPGATAIDVSRVYVNPGYTGEVIDQNDIAILRLAEAAPDYAKVYGLYSAGDLTGEQFNVVGNGRRSDTGGDVGANLGTGRMRQGENIYDYAWGNSAFGGFFTEIIDGENFFGTAEIEYSYVSDFDNGLIANDTACLIAFAVTGGTSFCQQGIGALEIGVAGGDSGGPGFIGDRLASINSYGVTFGPNFGDVDGNLNSSFGEFSGYVPIYIHEDWIGGVVPEPATWAMMIAGFGLVGGALRRRRVALSA
nr:PEPxxWA-CTERM sorting domain-containing protein [Sandaracinobacteroides sayramensis]